MQMTYSKAFQRLKKNFSLVSVFLVLLGCSSAGMAEFQEGKHYFKLDNATPGTGENVEVLEFFNYACPHCFNLEPYVQAWEKEKPDYIKFEHAPAFWNPMYENTAKAFYTAQELGVMDKLHLAIFDAIHNKGANFNNQEAIKAVFVANGVKAEDFDKMYSSFYISQKATMTNKQFAKFKLRSVPTIVVDGQWRTSLQEAGSHETLFEIIEFLSKKAKESRSDS
ncbi:MAG: thiol:disulfide interchange protein DsbA/DsbL [Pseudomonadota bacterium]|nr:hypothetical protein [Gammaproteobacteria bacterium]MEC8010924.1 thiol:disulfide interchange protein DsbA/DsbL [Pseudomonadota bacterium]HBF10114.1 hypothetical protein [Gammaproteobacteria bacterium]|tara:strand:+ start:677 stop:1345 length:669 start_codon:yes stop_codon:yes gene_type:complete